MDNRVDRADRGGGRGGYCADAAKMNIYCQWVFKYRSEHLKDEVVDELLAVAPVAATLDGVPLRDEPSAGWVQLEGPQEVVGLLEVVAHRVDLVDEVLDADDVVLLPEGLLDEVVVSEGDSLPVDLAVAALVDELPHGVAAGVPVGDVGLHPSQHIDGGLVDSDEDSVVELPESQEAQDADHLGVELVDTPDPNHEGEPGLGRDVQGAGLLGLG